MNKKLKQIQQLSYLAGLIDGEACLYMRKVSGTGAETRVEIQTVSLRMIEKIKEIYDEFDIEYQKIRKSWQPMSTRSAYRIRVGKKKSVFNLLRLLLDFLVVKKPEAKKMLGYLQKSVAVPYYKMTKQDFKIIEELKLLKKNV